MDHIRKGTLQVKLQTIHLLAALAINGSAGLANGAQVLNDEFNSLTMADTIQAGAGLNCSGGVATNTLTMSVPSGSGNWAMLVSQYYPRTWVGTTATQSWSISNGMMSVHAEAHDPYDGGLSWHSRTTLDRTKYLSAVGRYSLRSCTTSDAQGCMAGITLISSESSYREISFVSDGFDGLGQMMVKVGRFAPCDFRFFKDAGGNDIRIVGNQLKTFRIDYLGAEGGGWRYFYDGNPVYLNFGSGNVAVETTSHLSDANLSVNPHLGIYYTSVDGYAVEGEVDRVSVYQLAKLAGITASASNSYAGYPASNAVDGNTGNMWTSGGFPTQWIELDLGSSHAVRKLRLLVDQSPSGNTVHNVYVGTAPGPTSLAGTISQSSSSGQWLELDLLESGVSGRYVRITTTSSPSWVSWREIEVYE